MHVRNYICICVRMELHMCTVMYVGAYVCMFVLCMHVCMHLCMYRYMYVCASMYKARHVFRSTRGRTCFGVSDPVAIATVDYAAPTAESRPICEWLFGESAG